METQAKRPLKSLNEVFALFFEDKNFDKKTYDRIYGQEAKQLDPKKFFSLLGDMSLVDDGIHFKARATWPEPVGEVLIRKIKLLESAGAEGKAKADELMQALEDYFFEILEQIHEWDSDGSVSEYRRSSVHTLFRILANKRFDSLVEALHKFYERQKVKAIKLGSAELAKTLAIHQKGGDLKNTWSDVLRGKLNSNDLEPMQENYKYEDYYVEKRYAIAVLGTGMQKVDFETLKKDLENILKQADEELNDDIANKRLRAASSIDKTTDEEEIRLGIKLNRDEKIASAFNQILERTDLTTAQKEELEAIFNPSEVSVLRQRLNKKLRANFDGVNIGNNTESN